MGGFSKPHIDSDFKNGTSSIPKIANDVKIRTINYSPAQEAETLDLDVDMKPASGAIKSQYAEDAQLDELRKQLEERGIRVVDVRLNRESYNEITKEELARIIENYGEVRDKKPLIVYDSFHGEENESGSDLVNFVLEEITGVSLDDISKKLEDNFSEKYNVEGNNWAAEQQEKFKKVAGKNFNDEYKVGKKWKYDAIDFYKKELWDVSLDIWSDSVESSGKYGTVKGEVRLGSVDTNATVRVGADHAVLDASIVADGLKISASYDSPSLATRDGLVVLAAGVDGEISVLHAEAKARAGVGVWTDEKGLQHKEAGVQLKAEADLFKATATGKATVFGVTAAGSIGVKVGIGAQLDAGYVDGKLNLNLSLAVGVGIEVGISLDFGNAVEVATTKLQSFGKQYLSFLFT